MQICKRICSLFLFSLSDKHFAKQEPTRETTLRGTIILNRKLVGPDRVNHYFQLNGDIYYSVEILKRDPLETAPGYNVKLDISVEAILTKFISSDREPNTWNISSESEDFVSIITEWPYLKLKSYPVIGTTNKMELVCIFRVTTESVKLNSVNLDSAFVRF